MRPLWRMPCPPPPPPPPPQAFHKCLPKGVVNFISGSGRTTMPPLMESGHIDIFAFIGGSRAGDALIKNHPTPHKLRLCLGLDAKNPGVIMPDADLDNAVKECVLGATSFNGQRCTAIKIIFVHKVPGPREGVRRGSVSTSPGRQ